MFPQSAYGLATFEESQLQCLSMDFQMLLSCSVRVTFRLLTYHGNFAALLQQYIAYRFKQQNTKSLFQIVKHTGQNFQQHLHDLKHPLPTDYQWDTSTLENFI